MENIKKFDRFNEQNYYFGNIPTAEDFMNSKQFEPDKRGGITYEDYWGESADIVPIMLVKFAKLHVESALRRAHSNMQLPDEDLEFTLDAYPLSNIK